MVWSCIAQKKHSCFHPADLGSNPTSAESILFTAQFVNSFETKPIQCLTSVSQMQLAVTSRPKQNRKCLTMVKLWMKKIGSKFWMKICRQPVDAVTTDQSMNERAATAASSSPVTRGNFLVFSGTKLRFIFVPLPPKQELNLTLS